MAASTTLPRLYTNTAQFYNHFTSEMNKLYSGNDNDADNCGYAQYIHTGIISNCLPYLNDAHRIVLIKWLNMWAEEHTNNNSGLSVSIENIREGDPRGSIPGRYYDAGCKALLFDVRFQHHDLRSTGGRLPYEEFKVEAEVEPTPATIVIKRRRTPSPVPTEA